MESVDTLVRVADRLGVIATFLLLFYALHKDFLVTGGRFRECKEDKKTLSSTLDTINKDTKRKLDRFEEERDEVLRQVDRIR